MDGLHVGGGWSCSSLLELGLPRVDAAGAVRSVSGEAERWHMILGRSLDKGRICTFVPVLPDSRTCRSV